MARHDTRTSNCDNVRRTDIELSERCNEFGRFIEVHGPTTTKLALDDSGYVISPSVASEDVQTKLRQQGYISDSR